MMNYIWAGIILLSALSAVFSGSLQELSSSVLSGAADSVELVITLAGSLCFWCGISKISEKSGFAELTKKMLSPILGIIFPNLDRNCAAFNYIAMNITANLLGLGNAATPPGLAAMSELQKMNGGDKTKATSEMIRFVVMNTSSLQIIPTTVAAVRAQAGSAEPFGIIIPVWISSFFSLAAAVSAAMLTTGARQKARKPKKSAILRSVFAPTAAFALASLTPSFFEAVGSAVMPLFIVIIILYALFKKVKVFDCFVSGAKEGISTAVNLLPSLCALITAVKMAQESGAMDIFVRLLSPIGKLTGIPSELMPLCIIRPLSGSGGLSVLKNILSRFGADSVMGKRAAVICGASETTFYAATVYFGSIGIKKIGTALPAALLGDLVCCIFACRAIN